MINKKRFEFSGRDDARWQNYGERRRHRMGIFILICGLFLFLFAFLWNYFMDNPPSLTVAIGFGMMAPSLSPTDRYFRKSVSFTLLSLSIAIADLLGVWIGYALSGKTGIGERLKDEAGFLACIFVGLFAITRMVDFWRLRRKRKSRMG